MASLAPTSRLSVLACAALLAACSALLEPDRVEEPAALVTDASLLQGGGAIALSAETVAVGVPETVTVSTAGGGCLRKGRTDVRLAGSRLEIRPYTSRPTARDIACPGDFRIDRHVVVRTFGTPGAYLVRAIGRGTVGPGGGVAVERPLVVR